MFYGFDNWDLGGAKARLLAERRCKLSPNAHVISGHPLSSAVQVERLQGTDMLVIDGNHSFVSTLRDCACFAFLRDGAMVLFHDCGLGNRIWGCFWVYHLLLEYEVIEPVDHRFARWIADVDLRRKPCAHSGEKPEIEFAIGRLNRPNYLECRELLSDAESRWSDIEKRFEIRPSLDMAVQ
jgi:hypothetical protein